MGDGGREIVGDAALGGRDGDLGVEIQLWGWRCGSRGGDGDLGVKIQLWGMVICWVEIQLWEVEMRLYGVEMRMWIVGIFAYFSKEGELVEKVVEELVLQGNPHVVLCPCFSVDLENDE